MDLKIRIEVGNNCNDVKIVNVETGEQITNVTRAEILLTPKEKICRLYFVDFELQGELNAILAEVEKES